MLLVSEFLPREVLSECKMDGDFVGIMLPVISVNNKCIMVYVFQLYCRDYLVTISS